MSKDNRVDSCEVLSVTEFHPIVNLSLLLIVTTHKHPIAFLSNIAGDICKSLKDAIRSFKSGKLSLELHFLFLKGVGRRNDNFVEIDIDEI